MSFDFLKSDPDLENPLDLAFEFTKATADAETGDVLVEGYASTPEKDIDGDIVEPRAFEQDLKHFMRHPVIRREHKDPIGLVESVEFRPEGPYIKGRITHDAPNEKTRDMVARKLLRGFSARFIAQKDGVELLPKHEGRFRVKRARLVEVTVTDIPRNSGSVLTVKDRAAFLKSLSAGSPIKEEENTMFEELVAKLLSDAGFACKADQVSIMKALGDAISASKATGVIGMIAKSVGVSEGSDAEAIIAAIKAASDKDGMIPKSIHDGTVKQLNDAEVELDLLRNSDRISPANKEFAKSLRATSKEMFDSWVKTQPNVPTAPLPPDGEDKRKGGNVSFKPSPEDVELMKGFGVLTDEKVFGELVVMKPHEVASKLFGQPVSETAMDKAYTAQQAAWLTGTDD